MNIIQYKFTSDWFSHNIPLWSNILSKYKGKPNVQILEIGSYQGRSCIYLLENILTDPSSQITCIDTFEGSKEHTLEQKENIYNTFMYNIQNFLNKVIVYKGKSNEILREFDLNETYDIIYIDGDHTASAVIEDAILTFPLLKKGGIMIFDDYLWEGMIKQTDRPQMAINAFIAIYSEQIKVIHRDYQVIITKL